jgi:hypothetical protein
MRRLQLMVLIVLCLAPALALFADQPSAPAAITQQIESLGTPPDFAGRWLVLADLNLPDDRHLNVPHFWDVKTVDGKAVIDDRQVGLPPEQKAAMTAANEKHVAWVPTVADLETIRDQWATLPAEDRGIASLEHRIIGKDAFDEMLKNEELMQDADWVIQQAGEFRPNEGRPVREVLVWGGLEQTPEGFTGNHLSVAVAAAPFPIPISFKGTFRMYRMESLPERGFLARLLDVFAGCGRTR